MSDDRLFKTFEYEQARELCDSFLKIIWRQCYDCKRCHDLMKSNHERCSADPNRISHNSVN